MSEPQRPSEARVDTEKAARWLNDKWVGPKQCPVCQNNNWQMPDTVSEVRGFFQGGMVVGGPVFPILLLTCNVCGHVLMFNAIVMRLVERPAEQRAEAGQR